MFKAQWNQKLAKNKNGDPPLEEYFPFIEIINKLPRSQIFTPCHDANRIYPHPQKRRSKGDPRPMNSFMILTLVVRKVAEIHNVDLGDGRSCIRICQLMRWGASKSEWGIYLKLQKEFKSIHSRYYPLYDYRKKSQISDNKEFVIVKSDDYKEAEALLSESRNKKIASSALPSWFSTKEAKNGRMATKLHLNLPVTSTNIPYQEIAGSQVIMTTLLPYDFNPQFGSQDNFPLPISQLGSFKVVVPSSPSVSQEVIVPSSSPVTQNVGIQDTSIPGSPFISQVNSTNSANSASSVSSPRSVNSTNSVNSQEVGVNNSPQEPQVSCQGSMTPSSPFISQTQEFIPNLLSTPYFGYPIDLPNCLEQCYSNIPIPSIAVNCQYPQVPRSKIYDKRL